MRTARPSLALAAMLLCACAGALAAELGSLFHTPEERARLDRLRRGEPSEPAAAAAAAAVKPEVTGYVRRSDGRNTVWINGTAVSVAGSRGDALLDPRAVRLPGDVKIERGKAAEVKRSRSLSARGFPATADRDRGSMRPPVGRGGQRGR